MGDPSQISINEGDFSGNLEKLLELLYIGTPDNKHEEFEELGFKLSVKDNLWKVLIYDKMGQDVISPLLKVNDLREQGVTINLPIKSDRQRIPDTPAIYLISPIEENIRIIVNDMQKGLYEYIYIYFLSPCPRILLEQLATLTLSANLKFPVTIMKICDQNLDYICLDSGFVSLQMKDSYFSLKDTRCTDEAANAYVDKIVSSIHSILATVGEVPIIRCKPGGVEERVATKLLDNLKFSLLNSFQEGPFSRKKTYTQGRSRPLLIILDRSIDLENMIAHSWTYSALLYDIFEVNLNRIKCSNKKTRKTTYYDLDPNDIFWEKNASLLFSDVANNLNLGVNECKEAAADFTRQYGLDPNDELESQNLKPNTAGLSSAMEQVKIITERKRLLDMHMNLAQMILTSIKERCLDSLFSFEENLSKPNRDTLMELIKNPKIAPEDKIRAFIVYYLRNKNESRDELAYFESTLIENGCNIQSLQYLRRVRKLTQLSILRENPTRSSTQQSSNILDKFSLFGSKITDHLKDAVASGHIESLLSNVRQFLPIYKTFPVTTIAEKLSDNRSPQSGDDGYLYLDPEARDSSSSPGQNQKKYSNTPHSDVIIFIIGGGNILEYQNIVESVNRQSSFMKRVIYGSTEIISPQNFLKQLEALGTQI